MSKTDLPDLPDFHKCENCAKQLILSVYTSNRDEMLLSMLEQENVHRVCLAFANEGIAEIGTFSSVGCEEFIQQSEHLEEKKKYSDKNVYSRIFAP